MTTQLIEQAEALGRKAGIARYQRDQARVTFHRDFFRRWSHLEAPAIEDRRVLEDAYSRGYQQEA